MSSRFAPLLLLLTLAFALLLSGCQPAESTAPSVATSNANTPAPTVLPKGPALPPEVEPDQAQPADSPTAEPNPDTVPNLSRNEHGFARVTVAELVDLLERGDLFLAHIHFERAWDIPGTDLFLPVEELPDRLDKLPAQDALIVVYCRSGNVSQAVARYLAELGYSNVADLVGGYSAWHAAGHPLLDLR